MKRFGCESDLTTPFKDETTVFLIDENAPLREVGKRLHDWIFSLLPMYRDCRNFEDYAWKKAGGGNSWTVASGDDSCRFLYVLGGRRPPATVE